MSLLSNKVAAPQYDGLTSTELSALLNDPAGAESTAQITAHNANAKEVLSVLGATNGAAFLDALEAVAPSNSAVKWILSFLKSETGVNVGDAETRNSLDALATAGVLATTDVATIKALAETSISWAQTNKVKVTPWSVEQARVGL